MMDWLRRRAWAPILAQLKQGLSPEGLAWALALGIALSVSPVPGSTTLLCFMAAWVFRLNQPTMQAVNVAAYPLQVALFVPFIRIGERIFAAPHLPLSLSVILQALKADFWGALRFFWTSVWHAAVAWALVALPLACLAALILAPLFRRVSARRRIPESAGI
ncbi:MAG TPA: DUF2062 domain-containing protein [Holophagaceae bacterium]|nr:DUF2062 domain-containing protein [Holophagaceae bacterium]